jgi:hypothetical protein
MNDDNFGNWHDTDDDETRHFYREVQNRSVLKTCSICGRKVKLMPQYDKCDSCCRKIESGQDCY